MLDTATTTLLSVENVNQTYATGSGESRKLVLDNVSMSLKTGEIVALLGRSGSGKSTLLRIIAGLNRPTSGKVTISGKPVTGRRKRSRWCSRASRCSPGSTCSTTSRSARAPTACRSRRRASAR